MRKIKVIILFLSLLFCISNVAYAAPQVILDGQSLAFDVPPVIENGSTLVPLRVIFEALGADVQWDGNTQTVTATKSGTEIRLIIGGTAYKNGHMHRGTVLCTGGRFSCASVLLYLSYNVQWQTSDSG